MNKETPKILDAWNDEKDPNWQDVKPKDRSNYCRARHWIKRWGTSNRWRSEAFCRLTGRNELRLMDIGRKTDDPGDAFFRVFCSDLYSIEMTIWVEVTEVFFGDKSAKEINDFIKSLRGMGHGSGVDPSFLKSIKRDLPDIRSQKEIVNRILKQIEHKARKGQSDGSYHSLVRDYGRGVLIVGIPLWFCFFSLRPTELQEIIDDFMVRLGLGIKEMIKPVLNKEWCPFDSIYIVWDPTWESVDAWAKAADGYFYADPANVPWRLPFPLMKAYSFVKETGLSGELGCSFRWDRYPSLESMLKDQNRRFRFSPIPRPVGPKANLKIIEAVNPIRLWKEKVLQYILSISMFIKINGWKGLWRKLIAFFSVRRRWNRFILSRELAKKYKASKE